MNPDSFPGPLFTDLYELTMAAGYFERRMHAPATFSLFVRPHPKRGFFVAAGLQAVLDVLANFRFNSEEIAWPRPVGSSPNSSTIYPDSPLPEMCWPWPKGSFSSPMNR